MRRTEAHVMWNARKRTRLARGIALFLVLLFACAEAHELVPLLFEAGCFREGAFLPQSGSHERHDAGRSCAFCALLGTTVVATASDSLHQPGASLEPAPPVSPETLLWSDRTWTPLSHRGPPLDSLA